jgi:uncharacterized protein
VLFLLRNLNYNLPVSTTKEFFEAIRANDLPKIQSILASDTSLASAKNESGLSAVLTAIYSGRPEIRDLLLSHGAILEIHDAAAAGNLSRAKELVTQNPSQAKAYSPDGFPVIALAAVFGHLEIAKFLLAHGADINATATNPTGYNALTGAVASGHTGVVQWLLENGANANYRYGPGYSPLLTAAANGHLKIIELLITHCADPAATTDDGKSAIALATERNHLEVTSYLNSLR